MARNSGWSSRQDDDDDEVEETVSTKRIKKHLAFRYNFKAKWEKLLEETEARQVCCRTFMQLLFLFRVTTCPENLEMSGILTAVREMSGILPKVMEVSWKKSCQGKVAKSQLVYVDYLC